MLGALDSAAWLDLGCSCSYTYTPAVTRGRALDQSNRDNLECKQTWKPNRREMRMATQVLASCLALLFTAGVSRKLEVGRDGIPPFNASAAGTTTTFIAMSFLAPNLRPSLLSSDTTNFVCKTCRRNAASYRRTRKMLRVKQDPSFAPAKSEKRDHIIFNPPPSAPNVYHTPSKFLPPSDPRRRLYEQALAATAQKAPSDTEPKSILARIAAQRQATQINAQDLKPIRPVYKKKYHLTQEEVDEIRRLRTEDPVYWSRVKLAEKFNCSQFFVSLCVTAPERAEKAKEKQDAFKDRWGRIRSEARLARSERKKLWGRDA